MFTVPTTSTAVRCAALADVAVGSLSVASATSGVCSLRSHTVCVDNKWFHAPCYWYDQPEDEVRPTVVALLDHLSVDMVRCVASVLLARVRTRLAGCVELRHGHEFVRTRECRVCRQQSYDSWRTWRIRCKDCGTHEVEFYALCSTQCLRRMMSDRKVAHLSWVPERSGFLCQDCEIV